MWFLLPFNPVPWAVGPVGSARRGGKVTSYVGRNQQLYAYEQGIKEEIASQLPDDFQMIEGHIRLEFYFWRRMEEYTTHQSRTARNHEADLTNMVKAAEDGMQGVVYRNDKEVWEQHNFIMAQDPETEGKVLINVQSVITPMNRIFPQEAQALLYPGTAPIIQSSDAATYDPDTDPDQPEMF